MRRKITSSLLILGFGCLASALVSAAGVYKTTERFLLDSFDRAVPEPSLLWITGQRKEVARQILDHPYKGLRARYWQKGERTAWVFDEIGKELPITIGVVTRNHGRDHEVEQIEILAFRESRGAEVRHPFFTRQFVELGADADHNLTGDIDGISGATLSVWAVKRVARLALYLDTQTETLLAQDQSSK